MQTFEDANGNQWVIRFAIGQAMKLRDSFGIDVDSLISQGDRSLQELITDQWKIVEILVMLLEDQIIQRKMTEDKDGHQVPTEEFFNGFDGEAIDRATEAFLLAVCDSLPKFKRRPMMLMLQKLNPMIDQVTERIQQEIESAEFDQKMSQAIDQAMKDCRFGD